MKIFGKNIHKLANLLPGHRGNGKGKLLELQGKKSTCTPPAKPVDHFDILPYELIFIIASYLDINDWLNLQFVSKLWYICLNDPHLWASTIDSTRLETFDFRLLKRSLNQVFGCTNISIIKYLRIAITLETELAKCLRLLTNNHFPFPGKSIDRLEVINCYRGEYIYNLIHVRELTIDAFANRLISLKWLLDSQKDSLEYLHVLCDTIDWDVIESPFNDNSLTYAIKTLHLSFKYSYIPVFSNIFLKCPNLRHLIVEPHKPLSLVGLCQAAKDSRLESLEIINHSNNLISLNVDIANLDGMEMEGISEWPKMLKCLTLKKMIWSGVDKVFGSLEGVENLCVANSHIPIGPLIEKSLCSSKLKTLDLQGVSSGYLRDIFRNEFTNLEWINICHCQVTDGNVITILKRCPKLKGIYVSNNQLDESEDTLHLKGGFKSIFQGKPLQTIQTRGIKIITSEWNFGKEYS